MLGAPRRNAKLQLGKVICEEGVCDSRGQFISVLVDSLLEITLPDRPRTDPGVRNYRTGLLNGTRFALAVIARLLFSTVRFSSVLQPYMSGRCYYVPLLAPSPCERLSRLRVVWASLTSQRPSARLLLGWQGVPVFRFRTPDVLDFTIIPHCKLA